MPRTSERGGPQTRARIASVAARLFLERGFESVTVAEVAREAGVSSVTVFNHFPRKEDLFLDRAVDAAELLRSAVRYRGHDVDVLTHLRDVTLRLVDDGHPLSGVNDKSLPFFQTVAGSPTLIARAREIGSDLQETLTEELEQDADFTGDAELLAAFFIAGYGTVLEKTAQRLIAAEDRDTVVADHRARLDRLFDALRNGVAAKP